MSKITPRAVHPALVVFDVAFVQDEEFVFPVPHGLTQDNLLQYVAHVEGRADVRRTGHGFVNEKGAGDTTNSAIWSNPKPGWITYRVKTPTYRYFCLSRKDGKAICVKDIQLASGQNYSVPTDKVALVVMADGAATLLALAAGQTTSAGVSALILEVTL